MCISGLVGGKVDGIKGGKKMIGFSFLCVSLWGVMVMRVRR